MFNKIRTRILTASLLALAAASNALAVDPTSMTEVGTGVTTEITANKPMLFGIFGAILAVSVLLMIFRRGKGTVK